MSQHYNPKVLKVIDKLGFIGAIRFFNGYEKMLSVLGDYVFSKDDKISFIKEFTKKYNGISVFELEIDPIYYADSTLPDGVEGVEYIEYLGPQSVGILFLDDSGPSTSGFIRYEKLSDEVIDEILSHVAFIVSEGFTFD